MKEKYNMDDSLWCDLLYAKIHEREGFLFSQEGGGGGSQFRRGLQKVKHLFK
jgi:hypothetical protein